MRRCSFRFTLCFSQKLGEVFPPPLRRVVPQVMESLLPSFVRIQNALKLACHISNGGKNRGRRRAVILLQWSCPQVLPGLGMWHEHGWREGLACCPIEAHTQAHSGRPCTHRSPGVAACSVTTILKFLIPHFYFALGPANYVVGSGPKPGALDTLTLLSSFLNAAASISYQVCFVSHSEISSLPLLGTWAVSKNGKRALFCKTMHPSLAVLFLETEISISPSSQGLLFTRCVCVFPGETRYLRPRVTAEDLSHLWSDQ